MVYKCQIVRGLPTGKKRFFDLGPPPVALNVFAEIHLPIISGVSLCILEFVSVTVRVEDFIFLQGLFCYHCIGNSIHKSIVTDITMHNSHIKDIQIKE